MNVSSYRSAATRAETATPKSFMGSMQLLPFYAFVWMASTARVIAGVVRHEMFEAELTIALMVLILLPILTRSAWRELLTRERTGIKKV